MSRSFSCQVFQGFYLVDFLLLSTFFTHPLATYQSWQRRMNLVEFQNILSLELLTSQMKYLSSMEFVCIFKLPGFEK